ATVPRGPSRRSRRAAGSAAAGGRAAAVSSRSAVSAAGGDRRRRRPRRAAGQPWAQHLPVPPEGAAVRCAPAQPGRGSCPARHGPTRHHDRWDSSRSPPRIVHSSPARHHPQGISSVGSFPSACPTTATGTEFPPGTLRHDALSHQALHRCTAAYRYRDPSTRRAQRKEATMSANADPAAGPRLELYGGRWTALIPALVLIVVMCILSFAERAAVPAFWVGGFAAL